MQKTNKDKALYWVFKTLSIVISCALPIWTICEKFPLWKQEYGVGRSLGAGVILIMIVVLFIVGKTVFEYIVEKAKLRHAPPLVVWLILLVVAYILLYISDFIRDLTVVFWMGLLGCAIGTVLTYIAESRYGKKEVTDA